MGCGREGGGGVLRFVVRSWGVSLEMDHCGVQECGTKQNLYMLDSMIKSSLLFLFLSSFSLFLSLLLSFFLPFPFSYILLSYVPSFICCSFPPIFLTVFSFYLLSIFLFPSVLIPAIYLFLLSHFPVPSFLLSSFPSICAFFFIFLLLPLL